MSKYFLAAVAVAGFFAWRLSLTVSASNVVWNKGDVFAAIADGSYNVYDGTTGALKDTIHDSLGANDTSATTGCAFTPTFDKLYTTYFTTNQVVVYDNAVPHNILNRIDTTADPSGDTTAQNESIVFKADASWFVGHAGGIPLVVPGGHRVQYYDNTDTIQDSFLVNREFRGSDWVELQSNGTDLWYTSEDQNILRYDTLADVQKTNFNAAPLGGISAFALRLLAPGDGSNGLLVADAQQIKRLNAAGAVVQTYDSANPGDENAWFALNGDPNGTSFWSADLITGDIYKFSIATGAVELTIPTGVINGKLAGLCIKGEIPPPPPPGKIVPCTTPGVGVTTYDSAGYPDHSNPPRSETVFNESTVLKGASASNDGASLIAWYSDEHPLSLGVRTITDAKSKAIICNTPGVDGKAGTGQKPDVGCTNEPGSSDPSKRPIRPLLFMTDLGVADSNGNPPPATQDLRDGDWQQGAALHNNTGIPPSELYGTWKAGTSTVNISTGVVTFTPDSDSGIKKNPWPATPNFTPPINPKTNKVIQNEGYSSAVLWHIADLPGILAGHVYRMVFMVHDGDQNKSGGDAGEACFRVTFQP